MCSLNKIYVNDATQNIVSELFCFCKQLKKNALCGFDAILVAMENSFPACFNLSRTDLVAPVHLDGVVADCKQCPVDKPTVTLE